jgi:hypothetical protein
MRTFGSKMQDRRWIRSAVLVMTVACLFGLVTPSAQADSWNFSLTDTGNTANIGFSFAVGAPVTPYVDYFQLNSPVAWTLNGVYQGTEELSFWNASAGGGLYLGNNSFGIVSLWGPQLYTGSESAPQFIEGTYSFNSCCGQQFNGPFTLTLVDPPDGESINTPESSSALLLITGLMSMFGLAFYRPRRITLAPTNLG